MAGTAGFGSIAQALRQRNYRFYATGNAVNFTGTWMQRIAVSWLAWTLTESGTWLGIIAAADLVPSILFGPIAGAVADRYDRIKLLRFVQTIAMLQSATLVTLLVLDAMNIWLLFVLTAILGIANAFTLGVQLALIPTLITRSVLSAAVAFNSVIFNSARFVGPAMAGFIMHYFNPAAAIAGNMLSFVVFFACLSQVRPLTDDRSARGRTGYVTEIAAGYRYAAAHGGIAAMIVILVAISVGGRALNELLAQVSAQMFNGDSSTLATLMASIGIGAVVVGLWLSSRGNKPGLTRVALLLVLLQSVAVMALPFMPTLYAGMVVMFVLGFASSGAGIASQTLLQLAVDGAMRGRVLSLFGMIFRGGPALGALMIGAASDYVGIDTPVFIAGALMVLVFVWVWVRRQAIATALETEAAEPADGRSAG